MRKIKGLTICLTAIIMAFSASSCKKDNTLKYNNITMGNIVDGTFISDQGNEFKVVEQTCPGKLDTMKRAFTICDVLANTSGDEYDVRMNYIANVLVKDVMPSSEQTDAESMANGPIILSQIWISGGYVNLFIKIPVFLDKKKQKVHKLTVIQDLAEQQEGTYRFRLRHDASGEVFKDDYGHGDMVLAGAYASFPVSGIIKEEAADMILEWNSYTITNAGMFEMPRAEKIEISYTRSAFEHVPAEAKPSGARIMNLE